MQGEEQAGGGGFTVAEKPAGPVAEPGPNVRVLPFSIIESMRPREATFVALHRMTKKPFALATSLPRSFASVVFQSSDKRLMLAVTHSSAPPVDVEAVSSCLLCSTKC